jgi:hypothetical protein
MNPTRRSTLNLTRIVYWPRTNGYASSRPERSKEISRGQAERGPRARTSKETRAPEGRWTLPLVAPASLQGALTINP